uniref:Small ribosomal subunit protein bS6m n=1 Tax=Ascaris lumbricoides TaxID=6252 RepID=A0A0M3I666_ASCLU
MPYYEVTLITRALSKADLYKVLHRAATVLLNHGAIIEKMESLGYRDLPYKRISKQSKESVYTSNLFLIKAYMSLEAKKETRSIMRNDLDMVHVEMVSEQEMTTPPFECNLEEILKPPTERQAVKDLRDNQKLGHFTRQMIYKRTEKEWKSIPKSYPITPPRP